jgi:hypothetical protein
VFTSAVSTVTGLLDRRFLRNSFALSLAFIVLCAVVALAGTHRLGVTIARWRSWPALTQLLAVAGFIAVVWVVAAVVQSQTRSIIQVYEGYWRGPLRPLRRYGEGRYGRRLDRLRLAGQMGQVCHADPAWQHPARCGAVSL